MTAPATARSPWIVTALTATTTFFGIFALSSLVASGAWMRTVAAVLLVTAASVIAARMAVRSRIVPTLVGVGVSVVVMIPLFAVDDEGVRKLLPTPSGIGALIRAFRDGVAYAANSPAPAEATRPLIALVCAIAIVLFLVADHLAASWGAVATSGLILLLPWMPAVFLQFRVPVWALLTAVACWLIAMGAARGQVGQHRPPALGAATAATTATILAALLVVPVALGGNGWGAIPRFQTPQRFDTATRLNLALDLRNSLTLNSNARVLTYTSSGRHPDTLRLYALTAFDGNAWTREDTTVSQLPATAGVLWPEPVKGWLASDHQLLTFTVGGLSERNLPLPNVPRTVSVADGWFYDETRDEVATKGSGTKGLQYSVVANLGYFTKADLLTDQAAINAGLGGLDATYTEVPPAVDLARLKSLTSEVTTGAATRYAQALAIQNYLRDTSTFTYDTSVTPKGGDSVAEFLDAKAGYCVQFATTMVMMARTLDIPARLAVGFLGGRPGSDGAYIVEQGDAHAWPELYFPGNGWARFEPTPAVQTGAPPEYADIYAGQVPAGPGNEPLPTAAPGSVPVPTGNNPGSAGNPIATDASGAVPWWSFVVAAIVGAGVIVLVWLRRRAVDARAAAYGPESAWSDLRQRLHEDLRWPLALTPHEAADALSDAVDLRATGFSSTGHDALARLANAVSDHRYAPEGTDAEVSEMFDWSATIASEANVAVADETRGRPARAGGQSAPRRGA